MIREGEEGNGNGNGDGCENGNGNGNGNGKNVNQSIIKQQAWPADDVDREHDLT